MEALTIGEQLLLLSLDETKGSVVHQASQSLDLGLAGAGIMDLTLRGRLRTEGKHLLVADATPTGDEMLDEALGAIGTSRRPRDARHWVSALQKAVKHQRRRLAGRLVLGGVLGEEEHRVLGVFATTRYPVLDTERLSEVRDHVRRTVLGETDVTPATGVLVSLASACGVLDRLFTREERREARRRAREIARGEVLGKAVRDTVVAMNAAVMGAIVASSVAATAASTSSTSSC
jgi:hypothetical protein